MAKQGTPQTSAKLAELIGEVVVNIPDIGPLFEEDQGKPHDVGGQNTWVEIMTLELPRPAHRGAQVVVSGNVGDVTGGLGVTYQLAMIEVKVVVHYGASRDEVFRGFLGGAVNSHTWVTDQPIRADRITTEARLLIDGQPGSSIAVKPVAQVAAVGSVFYR
jgi:hypothetical protein